MTHSTVGLNDALSRVEQARNAIVRAKGLSGGVLRTDQSHLADELAAALQRLAKAERALPGKRLR